ncbi:MAG: ABC transporter substrate-binding protein [Acidimicrobiaceae bacterium]|nr:ABC transporter substrate-binding protein [Acidimicrobiaceae bacterium]
MGKCRVSLALGEYDRTIALISGQVSPLGVDLTILPMSDAWDRHQRMIRNEEFDIAELSLSSYLMAKERGQDLIALPIFPYRMFRHQFMLVRKNRGISHPMDLRGKRVGTPMYQTTTMLWVRGMLEHEYGVRPEDINWVTEREELVPFVPNGVNIKVEAQPVEELFAQGELDSIVVIEEVEDRWLNDPDVDRLFPNFPEVEASYYRSTGIYPIMHIVAVKSELVTQYPWLPRSLYNAFAESLAYSDQMEHYPRVVNLAWANAYFEAERKVFGGNPYAYGVARNRPTLEAAVAYSFEQGLTSHHFSVEDIFVPSLIDT